MIVTCNAIATSYVPYAKQSCGTWAKQDEKLTRPLKPDH